MGDVVGLVDSSNNIVVEYKYDAWGRPTLKRSLTTAYDALATLNPFRYRGYIYDEASGLYYLRSRFYNPVWGRFINADAFMGKVGEFLSHNQSVYCFNNSICYVDHSGKKSINAIFVDIVNTAEDAWNFLITEAMRAIIAPVASIAAMTVASIKDLPSAGIALDHFINGRGRKLNYIAQEVLINELKSSSELKQSILDNYASGKTSFSSSIVFSDTDLHLAYGHATYSANIRCDATGACVADVVFVDYYNFDEKRWNENGFVSDTLNNLGYIYQNLYLGVPYNIELSFSINLN